MSINGHGDFLTYESRPETIDYYISEFNGFVDTLNSLLRKEPETREAILNASYKDILCLRAKAFEAYCSLQNVFENKILQADGNEARSAATENRFNFGNE